MEKVLSTRIGRFPKKRSIVWKKIWKMCAREMICMWLMICFELMDFGFKNMQILTMLLWFSNRIIFKDRYFFT